MDQTEEGVMAGPASAKRGLSRLTEREKRRVADNIGLVYSTIKAMKLGSRMTDDVIQEGMKGLMRGVRKHDPARGMLSTCAALWIRQAVGRHLLLDRLVHIPIHARGNPKFRSHVAAASREMGHIAPAGHDTYAELGIGGKSDESFDAETVGQLRLALAALPAREREVIVRRMAGEPLKTIGSDLGITREWVRRIENRAKDRLKRDLAAYAD